LVFGVYHYFKKQEAYVVAKPLLKACERSLVEKVAVSLHTYFFKKLKQRL